VQPLGLDNGPRQDDQALKRLPAALGEMKGARLGMTAVIPDNGDATGVGGLSRLWLAENFHCPPHRSLQAFDCAVVSAMCAVYWTNKLICSGLGHTARVSGGEELDR